MLRKKTIRWGWKAVLVVSVFLMINCGGGGGGGDNNGTLTTYSISGTVTSGGVPLVDVAVALTGAASMSTTTDAAGNYEFTDLSGGDYTITPPSIPGYGFTPANRQVILSADVTGVSFDATPNTARAWGENSSGQLGDGSTTPSSDPVPVSGLSNVTAIVTGGYHSLALDSNGAVWAWGYNASGQLGVDQSTTPMDYSDVPIQVQGLAGKTVTAIAAGFNYSLALDSNGAVWAWGDNAYGQLGVNPSTTPQSDVPIQVQSLAGMTVMAIAVGNYHSLALDSNGAVWAWGFNVYGQIGVDRLTIPLQRYEPELVPGLAGMTMTAIAAGSYHSLAVRSNGTVWGWGNNDNKQLGRDTGGSTYSSTPEQVAGISDVETGAGAIAGGESHTIAVKSNGTVWAWGLNNNGQLGVDPSVTPESSAPVEVPGLAGVLTVAAGSYHSVIVRSNGTVWAWGQNVAGQLGNGSTSPYEYTPAEVTGLTNVINIDAGVFHSVAVKSP